MLYGCVSKFLTVWYTTSCHRQQAVYQTGKKNANTAVNNINCHFSFTAHHYNENNKYNDKQEVKVIWQKAPHGGPIPWLGVTTGGRKLYHWIPGVGFPISVP